LHSFHLYQPTTSTNQPPLLLIASYHLAMANKRALHWVFKIGNLSMCGIDMGWVVAVGCVLEGFA
jgi:hypothetical protein